MRVVYIIINDAIFQIHMCSVKHSMIQKRFSFEIAI